MSKRIPKPKFKVGDVFIYNNNYHEKHTVINIYKGKYNEFYYECLTPMGQKLQVYTQNAFTSEYWHRVNSVNKLSKTNLKFIRTLYGELDQ